MQPNLINQLYTILGLDPREEPHLHEGLQKLVVANVSEVLFTELPPEDRQSLCELVRKGKSDTESINNWLATNSLTADESFSQAVCLAIEEAVREFFEVITRDLDENKKQKVLALAKDYLSS